MKYLYILFLAVVLAACSNDDMDTVVPSVETTVRSLPKIELVTDHPQPASGSGTRTGDPGVDNETGLPDNVYIFMWMKQNDGKYMLKYIHRTNAKTSWKETPDPQKPDNRRYFLQSVDDYTIDLTTVADESGAIGKWYVIASDKELTDELINNVYSGLSSASAATTNGDLTRKAITNIDTKPDDDIKDAVLDLSDWTSADLGHLYSTPIGDTDIDDKGYLNGEIKRGKYTDSEGNEKTGVLHGNIRLYHAAAKIDFQWEVPADKQATTHVSKITVSGLPTECRIFEPANNPTQRSALNYIIGDTKHPIDDGNKWIGREYFYALEPSDGIIHYTVEKNGDANTEAYHSTPTPATKNTVFTGWYRISATVN